jgi:hypothetical protein
MKRAATPASRIIERITPIAGGIAPEDTYRKEEILTYRCQRTWINVDSLPAFESEAYGVSLTLSNHRRAVEKRSRPASFLTL